MRYTTGANTFSPRETDESRYHNITLYNTSRRKTECNFFFKALILFALQSSHFKILNIAHAHATNNGLYKKTINISKYRNIIPDPLSTTCSTIRRNAVDLKILMNISDQLHV